MAPWEKEKAFHVIYPSANLKWPSFVTWAWIIGCHFSWAFYKHNNIRINKTVVSLLGLSLLPSLSPSLCPCFPSSSGTQVSPCLLGTACSETSNWCIEGSWGGLSDEMLSLVPQTNLNKFKASTRIGFHCLSAFTSPLYLFYSWGVLVGDSQAVLLPAFIAEHLQRWGSNVTLRTEVFCMVPNLIFNSILI